MKRTIILVLVVALLAGLGYIGFSAQSSAAVDSPPQAQKGTKLVTIAEDLTVLPGRENQFVSEWLEVESFRLFKLYGILSPYVEGEEANVVVIIRESPTGTKSTGGVGGVDNSWSANPPHAPRQWVMHPSFDGLYSNISIIARNEGSAPVTVSLYLLMAKE